MAARRLLAWLVALPLMAAGTYVSHCHLFALVAPTQHDHAHGSHAGGGAATGVAFFCGLPFVYTCVGLLAIFVVVRVLDERRGGGAAGVTVSAWPFGLLAPLGFLLHQHLDGLLTDGTLPLASLGEPRFLLGLALQVPLGLVAFLVARLLLRVAEHIGRALVSRPARRIPRATVARPRWSSWSPRPGLLARLAAPRAPPLATVAV
jgi:hypothetical protein